MSAQSTTAAFARRLCRRAELCQLAGRVEHDVVGVLQQFLKLICPVGGTEHNRDTNVTRNILARGLLELEREFATAGEAKADEAAVNKDSGALSSMAGVGRGPLVAGIPFQVA